MTHNLSVTATARQHLEMARCGMNGRSSQTVFGGHGHVLRQTVIYTDEDFSPYFWHNGRYPDSAEYLALQAGGFVDYRLRIGGLVVHPVELSLVDLRAPPRHEQITQHFCIQGWSGIAKWGGVSMSTILELLDPNAQAHGWSSTRSAKGRTAAHTTTRTP
jgi:DMSO/TMAO reductase YedYZ molybdopterin-dependent catalytic subunit